MKRQEKEVLYNKFADEFGDKLSKVNGIISYLSTYPEVTSKIKDLTLLKAEDLQESQLEWISLINQFDHPLDKAFFKPYWVPVQYDGFDYFIDLSSDTYTFFEVDYFPFKPYKWSVNNIFQNISDLLIIPDETNVKLETVLAKVKEDKWDKIVQEFRKRDLLGFSGKIEPDSVENEYLFDDKIKFSFSISENTLVCKGVKPSVIGLLPHDCKIMLQYFHSDNCRYDFNFLKNKIKHIKEFTYLVQSQGSFFMKAYRALLNPDGHDYIYFKNGTLKIKHKNVLFLEELISKIENVKDKLGK